MIEKLDAKGEKMVQYKNNNARTTTTVKRESKSVRK